MRVRHLFGPAFLVAAALNAVMGPSTSAAGTPKTAMPDSFVYLRDVDPTIQQDMRYAGSANFTGRPVPGYDAPECILVREAAEALMAAQADLKPRGYALKVYDCYRPAQAVAAFVDWSAEPDDPNAKRPTIPIFPRATCSRTISRRDRATRAGRRSTSPLCRLGRRRRPPKPIPPTRSYARKAIPPTTASTWVPASTASTPKPTR